LAKTDGIPEIGIPGLQSLVIGYQPTARLLVVAYFDSALLMCLYFISCFSSK